MAQYWDCLKTNIPKVSMTRDICDLVNEYPKGVDGPSYPITADELKVLNSRYDCYEKEFSQPKDRLYCENATDSYKIFM